YTLQPTNFVLFGAGPIALLVTLWPRLGGGAVTLVARLALGGVVAALPLVAYHVVNGSLGGWYDDVVVAAFAQTDLEFIRRPVHLAIIAASIAGLGSFEPAAIVNGVFWLALLALPLTNNLLLLRRARDGKPLHPLPVVAVFFALVSVHNQI